MTIPTGINIQLLDHRFDPPTKQLTPMTSRLVRVFFCSGGGCHRLPRELNRFRHCVLSHSPEDHHHVLVSSPELCSGVHQKRCDLEGVEGEPPPTIPSTSHVDEVRFRLCPLPHAGHSCCHACKNPVDRASTSADHRRSGIGLSHWSSEETPSHETQVQLCTRTVGPLDCVTW